MNKVLLTGCAGFFGHHLVKYILEKTEWVVVGLDRIDSVSNLNNLPADSRLQVVHHDLRAEINSSVAKTLLTGRGNFASDPFDFVIHCAAASHVDRSVENPIEFVLDNVLGTSHLLEFFRKTQSLRHGGKILNFSTDEVFGPADIGHRFDPYERHNPNNPYAATKSAAESLCPAWANTYGLPIVTSHCTNLYGERQHPEKYIPMLIEKIRRGETILVHSDASKKVPSSRYYLYVDDASSAVLTILRAPYRDYQKYNISGGEEISNLMVAQQVAALLGRSLKYELVSYVPGRPRHDMRYDVDDQYTRALGWAPKVTFEEGLRRVVRGEDRAWEDT